MKRSSAVQLTILATLAAALVSCNRSNRAAQRCVDAQSVVVDDRYCRDAGSGGYTPYHWYYGGTSGYTPIGSRVSGGSLIAPSHSSPSGTSRGIIGGAGAAHGSGVSS
ncbi:MAG: hypothetical protein JSU00_06580 [Acidobacteria bacterium]|nr:hypothetical protein [Acidobacteriota bacterium]